MDHFLDLNEKKINEKKNLSNLFGLLRNEKYIYIYIYMYVYKVENFFFTVKNLKRKVKKINFINLFGYEVKKIIL